VCATAAAAAAAAAVYRYRAQRSSGEGASSSSFYFPVRRVCSVLETFTTRTRKTDIFAFSGRYENDRRGSSLNIVA